MIVLTIFTNLQFQLKNYMWNSFKVYLFFICVLFVLFINKKLINSFDVIGRQYQQKRYHLLEQAQGHLTDVNLFRFALTEQKTKRREGIQFSPLYYGGGMS